MLMDLRTALAVVTVLGSGCFQAEAPRPTSDAGAAAPASAQVGASLRDDTDPTVPELAIRVRDAASAEVRSDALYAIADAGSDADAAIIGGALGDAEPGVRRDAIVSLTGYDGDVPASLLATALNDADARVRLDAVEALGEIGGATARQALRQALNDPDQRVREAAAEMLAEP